MIRQISTFLAPHVDDALLTEIVREHAQIVEFKPERDADRGGRDDDAVYLIRKGSVTVSRGSAARTSCSPMCRPATMSARWR